MVLNNTIAQDYMFWTQEYNVHKFMFLTWKWAIPLKYFVHDNIQFIKCTTAPHPIDRRMAEILIIYILIKKQIW